MALYYVLLHFWLKLGDSEIVLRLPSVLAGIMAIPVLYALGARLFDWKTGILAAFLLAVNPIHVEYSQAARAYTLLVLMSGLSSLFFLRLMDDEPRIRTSFGYATTTALAASFHFLGILLVPIHWAALPLFGDLRRRALRLAIATGLVGLMLLPMIGLTASAASAGAASRFGWLPNSSLNNVVSFFCLFVGVLPTVAGALVAGCYALALRSAAAGFFETRPQTGRARTSWGFLMIGAVAPLACAVALSFFKPMLLPRYWFACLPLFTVLVAAGAVRLANLPIARIAAPVFVLAAGWLTVDSYTRLAKEDWRGAISYVLAQVQPGDTIALFPLESRFPFEYYADKQPEKKALATTVFPQWNGLFETGGIYVFNLAPFRPDEKTLSMLSEPHGRLWVISDLSGPNCVTPDDLRMMRERLAHSFNYANDKKFFLVDVMLWRSPPTENQRDAAAHGRGERTLRAAPTRIAATPISP